MEQMANFRGYEDEDAGIGASWCSVGSIASRLVSAAETRRVEQADDEDQNFVPVAWAAE